MKIVECVQCGSNELTEIDGITTCDYCKARYAMEASEMASHGTTISVNSDIEALLQKCVDDPSNRKRYADLILNLDPSNKEALEFLKDAQQGQKKTGFGRGAARVVAAGYTLGLSEVGLRAHKKFKDKK
jgi:hypothetical protein